jgi:hypothetical protein
MNEMEPFDAVWNLNPFGAGITDAEARLLTDRIKNSPHSEHNRRLIDEAYTSGAWLALGYPSWEEYVNAEFGPCTCDHGNEDA